MKFTKSDIKGRSCFLFAPDVKRVDGYPLELLYGVEEGVYNDQDFADQLVHLYSEAVNQNIAELNVHGQVRIWQKDGTPVPVVSTVVINADLNEGQLLPSLRKALDELASPKLEDTIFKYWGNDLFHPRKHNPQRAAEVQFWKQCGRTTSEIMEVTRLSRDMINKVNRGVRWN